MAEISDLHFNLSEDENILASSKINKFDYRFCSILFPIISIVWVLGSIIYVFSLLEQPVGVKTNDIFYLFLLIVFTALMFYRLVEYFKNTKYNRLYLTNKRFIVITKNGIESVEFPEVKLIDSYSGNYFLNTKNKKTFKFFSSDLSDLIAQFKEIYPKYSKNNSSFRTLIISLIIGILIFYIAMFYCAFQSHKKEKNTQIKYENTRQKYQNAKKRYNNTQQRYQNSQKKYKNAQCNFKNTDEYMKYLEKNIKSNWNPSKAGNYKSARIILKFYLSKDGTISNVHFLKKADNDKLNNSALDALKNTKLQCGLPSFINHNMVPVEFTFDYNVKKY